MKKKMTHFKFPVTKIQRSGIATAPFDEVSYTVTCQGWGHTADAAIEDLKFYTRQVKKAIEPYDIRKDFDSNFSIERCNKDRSQILATFTDQFKIEISPEKDQSTSLCEALAKILCIRAQPPVFSLSSGKVAELRKKAEELALQNVNQQFDRELKMFGLERQADTLGRYFSPCSWNFSHEETVTRQGYFGPLTNHQAEIKATLVVEFAQYQMQE